MKKAKAAMLLGALMISGAAVADLSTGLVAHWSFDDCTAKDNIGSTNGITHSTACVQGNSNKALSFDGINSFVDLQYRDRFVVDNQTIPITISAWIKTNNTNSLNRIDVFSDNSCTGWYNFGLLSGKPSLLLRTTDWGAVVLTADSSKNLADGKFHHITGIIDEQIVRLYADGLQVAQQTFSVSKLYWCGQTQGYSGGSIGGTGFKLNSTNTPEWGLFSGVIDELRIYNRALTDTEITALYKQTASPGLDMTQANCRYVAPIYSKMWQQMKVKKAPSCSAVLRYHTWVNSTRPENNTAGDYYSNRLANIDTSNQLFNARLKLIDDGISILSNVLDPDLRKAFTPQGYKSTVNIMTKKGIVKSLAAGKTPFKLNTLKGKVLNKAFKDIVISEKISGGSSEWLCHQFLDGAVADSCSNEAKKVATCGVGLATEGWKGAAGCVMNSVTTFTGFINNVFDIGQIVSIKQHNYGYVLINDYLNDYYAKGLTVTALDEVKLEADIQKYADQLSLSSGGLFTFADFDMQFVKDGIRDSILRNLVRANANVRTVEQIRAILNK